MSWRCRLCSRRPSRIILSLPSFCRYGGQDVAEYFRRSFESANVMDRVVMFLNLSNDPIIERILTPRCALTAAEYLAFDLGMHILVILTDMTPTLRRCVNLAPPKVRFPAERVSPAICILTLRLSMSARALSRERVALSRRFRSSPCLTTISPTDPRSDGLYHRGSDRAGS